MAALFLAPLLIFVFMYAGFAVLRYNAQGKFDQLPNWVVRLLGSGTRTPRE